MASTASVGWLVAKASRACNSALGRSRLKLQPLAKRLAGRLHLPRGQLIANRFGEMKGAIPDVTPIASDAHQDHGQDKQ